MVSFFIGFRLGKMPNRRERTLVIRREVRLSRPGAHLSEGGFKNRRASSDGRHRVTSYSTLPVNEQWTLFEGFSPHTAGGRLRRASASVLASAFSSARFSAASLSAASLARRSARNFAVLAALAAR